MADTRLYLFCKFDSETPWGFIALNTQYTSKLIPMEEWKTDDADNTNYKLCRICYTKDEAADFINKLRTNQLGMMEGPDIYSVIDSLGNNILTIWKPKDDSLELSYQLGRTTKAKTVDGDTDFESLITLAINFMNIKNVTRLKLTSRNLNHQMTLNVH